MTSWGFIKDIVITLGIEGRIEVDQINGVIGKVVPIPENVKVIAVVQRVWMEWHCAPLLRSDSRFHGVEFLYDR